MLSDSEIELGKINDVYTFQELQRHIKNPAKVGHDLLEVMVGSDEDNLVLVPFVEEIVPIVNIKDGHVFVDPPEGLFDIAKVNMLKKKPVARFFLKPAAGWIPIPASTKKRRRRSRKPKDTSEETAEEQNEGGEGDNGNEVDAIIDPETEVSSRES